MKIIVYKINDMVAFINLLSQDSSQYNFFFSYVDILLNKFLLLLFRNMEFSLAYWIYWILFFILNFISSYLLFKKLKIERILSIVFSLLYSTSIYALYRLISFTPSLYLVFFFPLSLYLVLSERTFKNILSLSLLIILSLFTSMYHGYFLIITLLSFSFFHYAKSLKSFAKIFLIILSSLSLVLLIFWNVFISNTPFLSKEDSSTIEPGIVISRPIQDYYNLSFRPWYFFIPPQSSLFFGELSSSIHNKISSSNYYLANDYMEEEMAGSYMGWHFILGTIVVLYLLLVKKLKKKEYPKFKTVYENSGMIIKSLLTILVILFISGPPSFTINGLEIFTPTYLLYHIVPVFRTLTRWSVVVYLFVLIINTYLVQDLYLFMKYKLQRVLFISLFLILNFIVFSIKIPIINLSNPPAEIDFLRDTYPTSVNYAVYPKGDYYSIFWITSHKDNLLNPVDVKDTVTGFDSNEFSRLLITPEGIDSLKSKNPEYLVLYLNEISEAHVKKVSEVNPSITTKDELKGFFDASLGIPIFAKGNIFIYNLR